MEALGELSVLNVGAGDIRVVFNPTDTGEAKKALRMLTDMQRRGYAIMVQLPDQTYVRAKSIDASTGAYIVVVPDETEMPAEAVDVTPKRKRGKGAKHVKVPMRRSRAVGVARSAGG